MKRRFRKAAAQARELGQYQLDRLLGAGGMGEVYLAHHALMRRPTAIKLLKQTNDESTILRFEREVRLSCQLNHPNTIAIYDYGRTADGIFYYAMELLDGLDLEELVQRFGPLSEARACHILKQACGSLAEAHANGLIHRDIKPANIFLTHRGGIHDFVKVLDFGLVREARSNDSRVTQDNVVSGTPAYMAPESTRTPDAVDHRIDVYALGCVAYYLVTGVAPFERDTPMQSVMAHVSDAVPTMSASGQSIAPVFEAMVMRCLAKDPAERYASIDELSRDLDQCMNVKPWSAADSDSWWDTYKHGEPGHASDAVQAATVAMEQPHNQGATIDIAMRT